MARSMLAVVVLLGTAATFTLPVFALPDTSVKMLRSGTSQISQVSSVSELTDVDSNSWAFQALKSLVERYSCIEGYPSKKYLGNRPLSRYEFAAGLNACLYKVGEQIAAATSNLATKDNLATVQRLQEEFKTELATLKGRVDALEAKTKELEAQQLSTTTKLTGNAIFAITGGGATGDVTLPGAVTPDGEPVSAFGDSAATGIGRSLAGNSANATFVGRTRLLFNTTFTGNDLLRVRLNANTGDDVSRVFGQPFFTGGLAFASNAGDSINGNSNVGIDVLVYSNTIGKNFRYWVGPALDTRDYIDINSFATGEGRVDFTNLLLVNNPYFFQIVGENIPGAAFNWILSQDFSLRAVYNAANGGQSFGFGNGGLFGGSNQLITELEARPSETSTIRLQYNHLNEQGTALTASLAGNITNSSSDVFGLNAEWAITPNFAVFGRYATASTHVNSTVDSYSDISSSFYQIGFALPDLFILGNTLGVSLGQPIRVNSGSQNGASLVPSGGQSILEIYYNYSLNDRVTLTPDLQFISQPNNIVNNSTITVGNLRMVFTF